MEEFIKEMRDSLVHYKRQLLIREIDMKRDHKLERIELQRKKYQTDQLLKKLRSAEEKENKI